MSECYDTGTLRLYMESPSAMPDAERAAIAEHLASCAECRQELDNLRQLEATVMARLSVLAPTQSPDLQAALMKMRSKMSGQLTTDERKPATGNRQLTTGNHGLSI